MKIPRIYIVFFIFFLIISILQYFLLKQHLLYGFADIDWAGLFTYKRIKDPFSLKSFLNSWNEYGVYATQYYFIGIQNSFFGLDYYQYNIVSYILKLLSTITVFPLFYIITKRKLIAVIGTLIYVYSFTSVAALYTVMTTINYLGIAFMNIFLWIYWYLVEKNRIEGKIMIYAIASFYLAFFLATERMYPLIPLVFIGELSYLLSLRFSKKHLSLGLRRLILLFAPAVLLIIIKPNIRTEMIPFFIGNSLTLFQKIAQGNWHLIFTPFAALGSMFLPKEYPLPLGTINLNNLTSYLGFLLGGPLFIFGGITLILGLLLSRKPRKFFITTFTFLIVLAIFSFLLATRRAGINPDLRMYFDPHFVMPNALMGMFIISLAFAFLFEWIDRKMGDNLILSLFMAPAMAFLFIFITWLPADLALVFMGIHRYLTIPAIGISFLLATTFVLMYDKLHKIKILKHLAFSVFLPLILLLIIYSQSITSYFDYELNAAGTKASEHIRMKGRLLSYIKNISQTEPSVFFFDESPDAFNSYFNETTILAGFNFWIMFRENHILPLQLTPRLIRSYFLCGGNGKYCPEELQKAVVQKDGIRGLSFDNTFYKAENFYAFRFIDRNLYDITDEVKQTIGLK